MNPAVHIGNPATSTVNLTVKTHRQDIAPGEPAALMGHVTLQPDEAVNFTLYEGAAIVITAETSHV